jgi:hypothetical protein
VLSEDAIIDSAFQRIFFSSFRANASHSGVYSVLQPRHEDWHGHGGQTISASRFLQPLQSATKAVVPLPENMVCDSTGEFCLEDDLGDTVADLVLVMFQAQLLQQG